ncbi:hypothetical protein [Paenibacillus alba]|uniref:Phage holin n=1 Tax=Paenibacillus alba TaxID=1197127 RepID=A0ABU6GAR0_9BACL|nr:hypothetical protein [Paenibacillus alba]MEC0231274.1 hypothetical protein [Paenibacillus alba]
MGNVNKALILPMLAFIALLVKTATGKEIPNGMIDLAADVIMGLVTLIGFFMHPTNTTKSTAKDTASTTEAHPDTFIQG